MNAITLINPFPSLIMLPDTDPRAKRAENRSWPPSRMLGENRWRGPLVIHAGKGRAYAGQPVACLADHYGIAAEQMVYGALVGMVDFVAAFRIDDIASGNLPAEYRWLMNHPHASGEWCHIYLNPRPFPVPVPYTGMQGFFNVPDELVAAAALAGTAPIKPDPQMSLF